MDKRLADMLKDVNPELLNSSEGRRALTKLNPILFAWIYLRHHITMPDGTVSFADCHFEWAEIALNWVLPTDVNNPQRHAFIAPRETGKSTWWYTILPIFWAAHKYSTFMVAFAHSDSQAQMHLNTFRTEMDENELLRLDYPELTQRGRRVNGINESDAKGMRVSKSGFVFIAKGIDTPSLGMKYKDKRPDTILLDDIEPHEAQYSLYKMEQRRDTLVSSILPLAITARVVLTGTTTMFGSLTHQLVKHNNGSEPSEWITAEKFRIHHAKPLVMAEDGTLQSMWPTKWPIEWIMARRHMRDFKKNYENDPTAVDSDYWSDTDFTYGTFETQKTCISIDGAVTTGAKSDYTGVSVVGCAAAVRDEQGYEVLPKRCLVKHASHVKLQGAELRKYVMDLITEFPEVSILLIETNQGGNMWLEVFHDMPIKIVTIHNTEKKETRAGRVLNLYQRIPTRVYHATYLTDLENEMMAFPRGLNDDMVDSTGTAILQYLAPPQKPKAVSRTVTPR